MFLHVGLFQHVREKTIVPDMISEEIFISLYTCINKFTYSLG